MEQLNLITALKEIQGEVTTDQEFARNLGISQPMYSYIKRGVWPPGRRTLRQIIKRYPHLKPLAMEAMLHE